MVPIALPTCEEGASMSLAMGLEKWPLLLVNNEQLDADWGRCSQLPDTWQGPENEVNTCRKASRNEDTKEPY